MTYSNADFTPGMKGYSDIKPFRFWCQKVLPLVYDDSLSYYELLCKVTDYINNIITDLATTEENVGALLDAYNELQDYVNNYFTNLDVQEEINNKLDDLVEDGTLTTLIGNYVNPYIDDFQEQMDSYESLLTEEFDNYKTEMNTTFNGLQSETESNLQQQNNKITVLEGRMDTFTNLPTGSTSGDAELADIRVGYDGTIYNTAGDAVRTQSRELYSEINNYNCFEVLSLLNKTNETVAGITYTWDGDKCTVSGSNTAISFTAMFLSKTSFPKGLKAGGTYRLKYSGDVVQFRIYYYETADGSAIQLLNTKTDAIFTIPSQATGIQLRLHVGAGSTVNEEVEAHIFNTYSNQELSDIILQTNILMPTGDNTDVTLTITSMLASNGVCHLGPGDFYVSGIDMPYGTKIDGCGTKTRIILLGNNTDEGYAIKLADNCCVESLMVLGSTTNIPVSSLTSTVINRHGILFKANYDTDQSTILKCFIRNVRIANFTGGGIACINTGYSTWSCVGVTDCYIYRCTAGLYVPYWSEFHRFVSVHCTQCYYGAINNGGNCTFIGCNFSSNIIGMLMDNSSDHSPNNSHGSVIGCTFDHENNNNGVGIKIDGCHNGEVFSDCQLFYADIEVNNSQGIQFNHFNIGGSGDEITVTKGAEGGSVIFNGCIFKDDSYTISVSTEYTACKFINCFTRNGEEVTA